MKSTSLSFVAALFISTALFSGCGLLGPIGSALGSIVGTTGGGGTITFPIGFAAPANSPSGLQPTLVAVSNYDGQLGKDILSLNQSDSLSLILNTAASAYAPALAYTTGTTPVAWVSGNFDGNGPSVVTANLTGSLSVFLNNGSGGFTTHAVATLGQPVAIVAVDFNGDGFADLAVVDRNAGQIEIFLNNTHGIFSQASGSPYAVGTSPVAIASADFNKDGKNDLVVANSADGTVTILYGNGNGTFANPTTLTVGSTPSAIAVADFNQDGSQDIATANNVNGTVSVLLSDGSGGFASQNVYSVGSLPSKIFATDLNGDGGIDIITLNSGDNSISVLTNAVGGSGGTGQFNTPSTNYQTGKTPYDMIVTDMNADGFPDIVVSNFADNTVSVFINDKVAGFLVSQTFPTGKGPKGLAISDMNNDTFPDIVVANSTDSTISILLQNPPASGG